MFYDSLCVFTTKDNSLGLQVNHLLTHNVYTDLHCKYIRSLTYIWLLSWSTFAFEQLASDQPETQTLSLFKKRSNILTKEISNIIRLREKKLTYKGGLKGGFVKLRQRHHSPVEGARPSNTNMLQDCRRPGETSTTEGTIKNLLHQRKDDEMRAF